MIRSNLRLWRLMDVLASLLLLVLAVAGRAEASEDLKPKPKVAGTAEEAVKFFVEAAKAGDVACVLAQVAEPTLTIARALVEWDAAADMYNTALDEKFGKDPKGDPVPNKAALLKQLKRMEIRDKTTRGKDEIELTIWEVKADPDNGERIVETRVVAVKEGPGWKLRYNRLLGARPQKQATRMGADGKEVTVYVEEIDEGKKPDGKYREPSKDDVEKLVRELKATYSRLTRDVKDGKYPTREDAERAKQVAIQKVLTVK